MLFGQYTLKVCACAVSLENIRQYNACKTCLLLHLTDVYGTKHCIVYYQCGGKLPLGVYSMCISTALFTPRVGGRLPLGREYAVDKFTPSTSFVRGSRLFYDEVWLWWM